MHALIVDDDQISRSVIMRFVRKLGFDVDTAASGAEALALLSRSAYDVVLMDCNMPDGNGFETAMKIRELETGAGEPMPIIAVTGGDPRAYDQLSTVSGMNDLITKPVTIDKLRTALKRWLEPAA
jgi:CheY-like chemotaxis protein